jgi:hypothetical protein
MRIQTFIGINNLNMVGNLEGEVNFLNSATWLGFDSILDSGGDPITDFTVTSSSGFNYALPHPAAIPIPAAVWLFGSALGLLGWIRRKAA